MRTLGCSFHFVAQYVCKEPHANCLYLSVLVFLFFLFFKLQLKMNAELPQTVLLKFIVMFVPCLTRPEGSGLLIHPPLTKRQNYKEEEFLRQLPSFYLQYEN